jgi:hypothetical protein
MPSAEVSINLTMNTQEASALIFLLGRCGEGTGETVALYEVLTSAMRDELEHTCELKVNDSGTMHVEVGEREES